MVLDPQWLYPRLGEFAPSERDAALRRARRTAFDVVELVGIALSLVLTTAITRYGTQELGVGERIGAFVLNVAVAIPLLAVLAGPFLVRRVRRGVETQLLARGR
jgi:hypothetical protein